MRNRGFTEGILEKKFGKLGRGQISMSIEYCLLRDAGDTLKMSMGVTFQRSLLPLHVEEDERKHSDIRQYFEAKPAGLTMRRISVLSFFSEKRHLERNNFIKEKSSRSPVPVEYCLITCIISLCNY